MGLHFLQSSEVFLGSGIYYFHTKYYENIPSDPFSNSNS